MTKKTLLPFLLLLLVATNAFAQKNTYNITGFVKDSLTSSPEPYATVRLLPESGSKAIAVAQTDDKGKFQLNALIEKGKYLLEISTIGKQTQRRRLDVAAEKKINVSEILLQENSATLGEASVTAQRQLMKAEIDRIGYSVKDDPDASTGNMLDILRKVPMVTVDGEDNIKVNGSSGFKIYVNGKPNQMMSSNPSEILKSFPAAAVQKVEVITDPGAKYDAEGISGILNIVTTTNAATSGYLLTPNIQVGNRELAGSVFGMAQLGKFTISTNYVFGKHNNAKSTRNSERETFADETYHLLKSAGYSDGDGRFQFGNLEASYEFDTHNLLSISAGIRSYHGNDDTFNGYGMTDINGSSIYRYDLNSRTKIRYDDYNFSSDYQHTFAKEGQTLTLSYRLSSSPTDVSTNRTYSDMENVTVDLLDNLTEPDTKSNEHTAQVDFTTPLGKVHTLSTGLKYIYRLNRNTTIEMSRPSGTCEDFETNEENSSDYRHRTDIAAAYGEYRLNVRNYTARAGLRYEWSKIKANYPDGKHEGFSSEFSDFVPSITMGYNIKPTMMVKAAYNLRIGRPGISYLSPYVQRSNAETQQYGNPNLDSEKANNFELTFNTFAQRLSIYAGLRYTLMTNGLTSYTFLNDENIMTSTYGNLLHRKQLVLNANINWNITKTTSFNIYFEGEYSDLKAYRYYGNSTAHNSGFKMVTFAGLQQTLPWKLKLSLNGGGSTRGVSLQGRESSFYFYSLGLSRSFLKEDRLSISLRTSNFLNPHNTMHEATATDAFRTDSYHRVNMFRCSIGISYRLGSLKTSVKKAARTISNTDVVKANSESGQGQQNEMQGSGM